MGEWTVFPKLARFAAALLSTAIVMGCGGNAPASGAPRASETTIPPPTATPAASRMAAVSPSATAWVAPNGAWDRVVDIGGGVMLHMRCTAGKGPTVILDADLNGDMSEYDRVIPDLPLTVRACAYDRAGEGSSDPPSGPDRTSSDIARELKALLTATGLTRPFVLVGNHFGGLFDLRYAALYPDDVAGLVLLDPMLPTAFMRYHADCAGVSSAVNAERFDVCALLKDAASAVLKPPDVPLVVLSAADNPGWSAEEFAAWLRSHRDLAGSVSNGRQAVVTSDLVIPIEQPDATVQAIEGVVEASIAH